MTIKDGPTPEFKATIQAYLNNFRRNIGLYLKPDVALRTIVYPFNEGSIVKIEFAPDKGNVDEFRKISPTFKDALLKANVNLEDDKGQIVRPSAVKGTNIVFADNGIYLFKDMSEPEWSDKQAKEDIDKIVNG